MHFIIITQSYQNSSDSSGNPKILFFMNQKIFQLEII